MNKEEFLKAIMELSKVETINPISTINSINVDDLMSAIDRLNKVPTYDELLKENKKQQEVINKINLIIKGVAYGGSEDYYMEKFSKINELIKEVSE